MKVVEARDRLSRQSGTRSRMLYQRTRHSILIIELNAFWRRRIDESTEYWDFLMRSTNYTALDVLWREHMPKRRALTPTDNNRR